MSIEIRCPEQDEYAAAVNVMTTAFLERPDIEKVTAEIRESWVPGRTWVAYDDGRACGTFRSWGTQVTVPGGRTIPAAAVSAVTVLPTHRRRGILTRMAAVEHAAARQRGEAAAVLLASEYPIYGRFGYGPATRNITWTVAAREASVAGPAPAGSVELAPLDEATRDTIRGVYEAARLRVAGEIWRRDITWQVDLALRPEVFGESFKGFVAIHRDVTGAADGYVRYKADPRWGDDGPEGVLTIADLHAPTDGAYAALWRFLLEIDLVRTVKAESRPLSERLPWLLTNARAARATNAGDYLWVRLFDVAAALEARSYERAGSVVLEVVDAEASGGRHRLLLDASPEGATCRPTDRAPEITVPVAALGGAYLGGTRLRDIVLTTGADEHRAGALSLADALLRAGDEPWCSTFF